MKKEQKLEQQQNSDSDADNSQVSPTCPKPIVSSRLYFYRQPFRSTDWLWVYDANNNFVFQFQMDFGEDGEYVGKELRDKIIKSINGKKHIPIKELNLSVDIQDDNCILNNNEPFILIRGWGNLVGPGGHNLPTELAVKIQDDFRDWLIRKLSVNGCYVKALQQVGKSALRLPSTRTKS